MVVNKIDALKYFSLSLLTTEKILAIASPRVTTGQIFEDTNIFHREGLFSIPHFGDIGSKERNRRNAHIDIKIKVLHPLAYIGLTTMSAVHASIIDGKKKAKFDDSIKDFVLDENGETGLNFYIKHFKDIKFTNPNNSDLREFKIRITKIHNIEDLLITKVVVLAAGLRDYTIDKSGKPSQGEINDFYVNLINTSNMLPDSKDDTYNPFIETIRAKMQKSVVDIYLYSLKDVLGGKRGLIKGHLMSKTIKYSTRNVITSNRTRIKKLGGGGYLTANNMSVGLYQHSKAIEPITVSRLKNMMLQIFSPVEMSATAINNKTKQTTKVKVTNRVIDSYTTTKGLQSYLTKFGDNDFSRLPFGTKDDAYAMILDKDNTITLVTDTSTIPIEDHKYLRPATNMEVLYIAITPVLDKYYATTTRYPAINQGSTFPVMPIVVPTVDVLERTIAINGMDYHTLNYPVIDSDVYDSISIHPSKLQRLGADFDGDFEK